MLRPPRMWPRSDRAGPEGSLFVLMNEPASFTGYSVGILLDTNAVGFRGPLIAKTMIQLRTGA